MSPRSCQSSQLTATDAAAPPFGSKYVPPWPTGRFATATGTCEMRAEVVHAVLVRDVFRSAEDVDRRRVQRRQHVLTDVHAGNRARAAVEHARVLQHHRLHARVFRDLERLEAAAAPAGQRDQRGIDAAEERAAGSRCSRRAPSRSRRSGRTPSCAAAGSAPAGPAERRDAARAAERPARSGCGRSRSPDSRARRSRADAAWCSRRHRSIRRCPRRPRPASVEPSAVRSFGR